MGAFRRIAAGLITGGLLVLAGGPSPGAPRPRRVAILAPDLALAAEQAAAAELRARGFTVVPEVRLYRAIERLAIREHTAAGRRALVRALRLSATMTIQLPDAGTRLTARGLLRDPRDRLIRVWRWSQDLERAPAAPTALAPPPPAMPPRPPPPTPVTGSPVSATITRSLPAAPDGGPRRPEVFALSVGPRLLYRRLAYAGAPPGQLTNFETQLPALGLGARADWVPLSGPLGGLGLGAQLEQTLSVRSQTPVGEFLSSSHDVGAAARWRADGPRLTLALDLGLGLHRFDFRPQDVDRRLPRPLPDVAYRYVQAGLELRARAGGRLTMVASGHYRHVVHGGGVTARDWFPGARIRGLDASAGVEVQLIDQLTAAVGLDARRYDLDFRRSRSTRVSAGASDRYYSGWARLGFRLGTTRS